jgi:hypothetical protein
MLFLRRAGRTRGDWPEACGSSRAAAQFTIPQFIKTPWPRLARGPRRATADQARHPRWVMLVPFRAGKTSLNMRPRLTCAEIQFCGSKLGEKPTQSFPLGVHLALTASRTGYCSRFIRCHFNADVLSVMPFATGFLDLGIRRGRRCRGAGFDPARESVCALIANRKGPLSNLQRPLGLVAGTAPRAPKRPPVQRAGN